MLLLAIAVASAWGIPAGTHGGACLYTDLSGNGLYQEGSMLSSEPGAGRNTLSTGDHLFWKECPQGSPQRVVREDGAAVYENDFFSGPYPSPYGAGFMVSVPGDLLVMDQDGSRVNSFHTGEYAGSLAAGEGTVWFVSSREGTLKRLDPGTGGIETVPLPFTPFTVQFAGGFLLLERDDGDLSLCTTEGREVRRIQGGSMARFSGNGMITLCRWKECSGCEATAWEVVEHDTRTGAETCLQLRSSRSQAAGLPNEDPAAHFDVPYIHQRWDTPDWFNGSWSCGPTSCMMAVQYYNRLTPDSIWCSYPEGHWSQWGNYIPVEYTFLGYTYDILGVSPGSVWVPGAHGFICRDAGGAYWSYMVLWMERHGLDSSMIGTTWSACTSELDGSWPVVASTTSIYTSGHILLFNGYNDDHSVICNDSYGNQNLPGWGSYYNGKDVVYDWPGYNNGNTQLGISQLFSARSEVLSPAGLIVDDRTQGYGKLGPCQYWHEQATGYNGYSWWTYSTGALPDTCEVEWIPLLPAAGSYSVETYVPASHSTAVGIYHVRTASGLQTAYLDQNSFSGEWALLGTWNMDPATAMVRMGDYTGTQGQYISFDAMRFTPGTSCSEQIHGTEPGYFSPVANPVSASSPIRFTKPASFSGEILVFDLAGREVARTAESVPGGTLEPGIYFARISDGFGTLTARFTVTR